MTTKLNMQVVLSETEVMRIIAQHVQDNLGDGAIVLSNSVVVEILTDCPRIKQVTVQVR